MPSHCYNTFCFYVNAIPVPGAVTPGSSAVAAAAVAGGVERRDGGELSLETGVPKVLESEIISHGT